MCLFAGDFYVINVPTLAMITKTVVVSKEAQRRELLSDWIATRKAEALRARHLHTEARPLAKTGAQSAGSKFAVASKRQK